MYREPQKKNQRSKIEDQKWIARIIQSLFICFFFLLAFYVLQSNSVFATAGINRQINFQGKVVNKTDGTNLTNTTYPFVFKFYDASSAGNQLPTGTPWTESQTLSVTDGIFRATLGSVTPIPAGLNFNDDSIYLEITFNGETFTTRVRMTSVPYALNAEKVGGLTVTSTTGTLTIPSGKTIQFADAFTTSGAFPLTLTSSNTTNATLPSGTITLVDLATSQSLTNKTIGSTGLTFSGAATDITTISNEDLVIALNGTGKLDVVGNATVSANLTIGGQLQVGRFGAEPSQVGVGSMYYNTSTNKFRCYINAAWADCDTNSGGNPVWSTLQPPTTALNMNMYQSVGTSFATTFTYGNATSTTNLFNITDTSSNSGTGYLFNLTTASSSNLKPFHVSSAGTEAILVDASGNVGIGNLTPLEKLDVTGNATVSGNLTLAGGAGIIAGRSMNVLTLGDAQTGSLNFYSSSNYLTSTGNLTLAGTIAAVTSNTINSVSINAGAVSGVTTLGMNNQLTNSYANSAALNLTGNASGITFGGTGANQIITGGSNNLALMPAGNVGIGTTLPSQKLDISGNATASGNITMGGQLQLGRLAADPSTVGVGAMYYNTVNNKFRCYINSAWADCDTTGAPGGSSNWTDGAGIIYPNNATLDLLIGGTATSSAKFAFMNVDSGNPTASISGNLSLGSPTGVNPSTFLNILNGGSFNLRTSVGGNGTSDANMLSRLFVNNDGNVGIGTTTPGAKLDVNGNITVQANGTIDTSTAGSLTIGGATQNQLILGRAGATTSLIGSNITLGGIAWGGTSNILSFTGALSGILQGNNTSAPTAITGINNTIAKWSTSAPYLTNSNITDDGTTVTVGNGVGNIILSLDNQDDILIGTSSATLSTNYSKNNYSFVRDMNGTTQTQNGSVLQVLNIGGSNNGVTNNPDMILVNVIPKTGSYTGNLLRLKNINVDKFVVDYSGNLVQSGTITANTTNTINGLSINSGALSGVTTLVMSSTLTNTNASSTALTLSGNAAGITFSGAAANTNTINTSNNNNLYVNLGTGNMGVGNASPLEKLDVTGNATISGNLTLANSTPHTIATRAFNGLIIGDSQTGDIVISPGSGKGLQVNAVSNTVTSTQALGTVLGLTDSTNITAAATGLSITLSGTGAFDQTGLSFALSGASGTNLNDVTGSSSNWKVTTGGGATFAATSLIGSTTNGFTFNPTSGPSYTGTARPYKTIILSPEYSGASLTAFYGGGTETNITGNLTSDASSSAGLRTHYTWTGLTPGTLQSYTVAVRVQLPQDFSQWCTTSVCTNTNALQIDYVTLNSSASNNALDINIYNSSNTSTAVYSSTGNATSANTWTTFNIQKSSLESTQTWNTAGDVAIIYLRMKAMDNNFVLIGDIKLNYLGKF